MAAIDVVIASPICRRSSFALDKFLSNQSDIQRFHPECYLVLATDESEFIEEAHQCLTDYGLRGQVIFYETKKTDYARNSRISSVTCGREAVRRWFLTESSADYLFFCDADMTYDASIIDILLDELRSYDGVYSGYIDRSIGSICLQGLGCTMFRRDVLNKVKFRCMEFNNGQILHEDFLCYVDLARCGAKIKRGIFATISHYHSPDEARTITPQPLDLRRRITTHPWLVGYIIYSLCVIFRYEISVLFRFDVGNKARTLINRFTGVHG